VQSVVLIFKIKVKNNRSLLSHMNKLIIAHVERLFVTVTRIEPSTFRPEVLRFYQVRFPTRLDFVMGPLSAVGERVGPVIERSLVRNPD
jgi:hypothetical protein